MDTSGPSSSSFSAAHYFPARRRVWQACTNCRARKTRCDAAKPKCSLCVTQNVECVYRDSNQPRIEQNTRILLERIQMLEDRLFASPVFAAPQGQQGQQQSANTPSPQAVRQPTTPGSVLAQTRDVVHDAAVTAERPEADSDGQIPIPLSHTANANHVFEWPIVQQLLSERRVSDSFHWAHATAVKCEALARREVINTDDTDRFSDAFRRLFWVSLIYEGDFVSEISITLPSGIARYEDVVPYPAPETPKHREEHAAAFSTPEANPTSPAATSYYRTEELVAFQISTNAAIRRFLNRVNSVVYDSKDQFRMTRTNYANWLLRITEDLWSYHGALYRNLPDFLLTSQPRKRPDQENASSPLTPGIIRVEELGNNPWNVLRLKGRYYAGQYIIHRPFLEYVLLNMAHFDTHPCKEAILERCRLCLEGCRGFINVFDIDPANSLTGLFASGMVTFTMVIILRVATMCPVFQDILPADIEQAIFVGTRNMRRFSLSAGEFEWHLGVLERMDMSCKIRMAM
ncbi:Citrinin biosynthesis transcriptional activator ctnR [Colletotrichum trifolii]|uniref:Citrinin biosynthesis transcriptional activator ctnR n=1 Tax=Colletotrichum trifolii TaxID=5466 RepID=A0A4R8RGI9_COLTR|nr:Citrinin biosynthesis transcriptional activator ctnR [Colletotrichum trifolii]